MLKRISIPLAFIAIGVAHTASAGTESEGPWVASFRFGTSLLPHGKFQAGAGADVANLGSINAGLAGRSGTVELDSLTFDDIFRVGPNLGLELGYQVARVEPFARVSYTQFRGQGTRIGDIHSVGLTPPATVRADFDDMESWAFDVGARYFMHDAGPVRTYLAGYVGVDRSDALRTHVRVNGALVESRRRELLPRETRFDAGVEVGMSYDFAEQASLRFSVGADYKTSRHEATTAYQALGVGNVRITDQTWSLPIDLGLSYRF